MIFLNKCYVKNAEQAWIKNDDKKNELVLVNGDNLALITIKNFGEKIKTVTYKYYSEGVTYNQSERIENEISIEYFEDAFQDVFWNQYELSRFMKNRSVNLSRIIDKLNEDQGLVYQKDMCKYKLNNVTIAKNNVLYGDTIVIKLKIDDDKQYMSSITLIDFNRHEKVLKFWEDKGKLTKSIPNDTSFADIFYKILDIPEIKEKHIDLMIEKTDMSKTGIYYINQRRMISADYDENEYKISFINKGIFPPEEVSETETEDDSEPKDVSEPETEDDSEPEEVSETETEDDSEPEEVSEPEEEFEPEEVSETEPEEEFELELEDDSEPEEVSETETEDDSEPEEEFEHEEIRSINEISKDNFADYRNHLKKKYGSRISWLEKRCTQVTDQQLKDITGFDTKFINYYLLLYGKYGNNRRWKEMLYIKENFENTTIDELGKELGLSTYVINSIVSTKREVLKLKKKKVVHDSEVHKIKEEMQNLVEHNNETFDEMIDRISNELCIYPNAIVSFIARTITKLDFNTLNRYGISPYRYNSDIFSGLTNWR